MKHYITLILAIGTFMLPLMGSIGPSNDLRGFDGQKECLQDSEGVDGWLKLLGIFYLDVYAPIKVPSEKLSAMQPYLAIGARDPHQLLRIIDFMGKLTVEQRLKLMKILEEYSRDRLTKAALSLCSSLTIEQAENIQRVLEGGISSVEERAGELLRVLGSVVSGDLLSTEQVSFINRELAVLSEHKEIQAKYKDLYNLNGALALQLQKEAELCNNPKTIC